MNNKLHVGQLSFSVDNQALESFFAGVGTVISAKVITDRDTGKSKGFGFVEMENDSLAQKALDSLNGTELSGRAVVISIAKPQEKRTNSFGGDRNGGRR